MKKTWFTSDIHFSDTRTLELSRRPFCTVAEMDEFIINNWNSVVGNDDIVYHLGDVGHIYKLNELNYSKLIILPGNYDDWSSLFHSGIINIEIIENNTQVILGEQNYKLVHAPKDADDPCAFYLFGHIHKLQMVKRNGLCVCTDAHNFFPIDLGAVGFYRNAIENYYDENVFCDIIGGN